MIHRIIHRCANRSKLPFFAFPPAVRKIIYTTNAPSRQILRCKIACRAMIESLNRVIRKSTKTRGSFPTDDAATKLIYLAIRGLYSIDPKSGNRFSDKLMDNKGNILRKKAARSKNGWTPETNSLSYTQNGSINEPSKPHGLNLIHRVSDTPGT